MPNNELGEYYAIPVILSFDGVDKQVNATLGKAFGTAGKKAGTEFGKQAGEGIKSTEADVKRALTNHAKLADKAADANGKLKVALAGVEDLQQKGITSGQRWERAQAAKEKATRDHTRALRDAEDALKDFESAQKNLKAPDLGGFGDDAGDSFMSSFGGAVASLGTKAGPIGVGLAAAGGLAFAAGGALATQVMAGMEQQVMGDHFAAQLGMSEEESAVFGKIAGDVYANNFGESMGDVGQAVADVQSTLGKAFGPGALEDITAKALTFRDVFGTDVADSIAFAQNLIVNGLAPDTATAFDLMTTAFQRVPAAMRDELPEILNEYSTNFQTLGYSGEEAFGMLVKAAPQGKIVLDKIGDSLKEFMILATDLGAKPVQDVLAGMWLDGSVVANNLLAGGDTAQRQFDQIVDGLLSIQDPAQQAAAATALFGTPLEDLDKSKIPQFLASLDNAEQGMQGFAGSAQRMVDTVGSNTAASVETAKRQLELGMSSMQGSLAEAFGPGIEQVANWLVTNEDKVTNFFTTAANAGAEFGAVTISMSAGVVQAFGTVVGGIGDGVGFMLDSFEAMAGGAASIADAVGMDGLAGDLRGTQQYLGDLSDDAHGAGEDIKGLAAAFQGAARDLHDFDANMAGAQTSAQNAAAQIAGVKTAIEGLPGGRQINLDAVVVFKDQAGRAIDPSQLLGFNPAEFATAGDAQRARRGDPYNAATPAVTSVAPSSGPMAPVRSYTPPSSSSGGGSGSSSASEPPPYFDRSAWGVNPQSASLGGYPGDAALLANVPAGRYTQGERGDLTKGLADCSSAVEDLVNLMDGRPTGGASMSTHNADEWLRARGFAPGEGGIGDMRVAFNSGHMQATLPDGTPFNWGSDAAAARGGIGGSGADDPALTSRYYRPAAGASIGMDLSQAFGPAQTAGPGMFEVDQQSVFDAESAVIKDQHDLEQKRLELLELKAKGNAAQSDLVAAENAVLEQERELQSSQGKLAEARQGKLQQTKSAQSPRDQGGAGQLGPLGEIFGSFIKETFGLDGSFLPALDSLMPIQMAGTLLDALAPLAGPAETAAAPFGMPDVAVPPMPAPGVHAGAGGAPGPTQVVTVDASQNFGPGSTIGWDPARAEKERQSGLARAIPRIPPGP